MRSGLPKTTLYNNFCQIIATNVANNLKFEFEFSDYPNCSISTNLAKIIFTEIKNILGSLTLTETQLSHTRVLTANP